MRLFNTARSLLGITRAFPNYFQRRDQLKGLQQPVRKKADFRPQYELLEDRLAPATLTWTGLGATNDWSEGANWSSSSTPASGDIVVFDGTSTKAATVDSSFAGTVAQLQINSGYSGTITLARNLTLSGAFTQAVGTFDADSYTLTVGGNFTNGGGTFDPGSGTLAFNYTGTSITHSIDVNSTLTLNHLVFGGSNSATKTFSIASGDTLDVQGDFTFQRTGGTASIVSNGGTIAVQGDVTVGAGANGGTTIVQFANTSADQEYISAGGVLPLVEIINGTRTVSAASGTTDLAVRSLTLTSGTFEAPTGTLTVADDFTQTSGDFDAGTGTLLFNDTGFGITHTIDIDNTLTLNHLSFGGSSSGAKVVSIASGDTLDVQGNFTMQRTAGSANISADGGTIAVQGNVTVGAGANSGSTVVKFANTTQDQTFASTGGILPVVEIANGTRTVSAAGGTTALSVRSLTLTSGTFEAPTGNLTIAQHWTRTGGTFDAGTGSLVFNHTGNYFDHVISLNGSVTVNHLLINDSGAETKNLNINSSDTINVLGDFTMQRSGGSANVVSNGGTIIVHGDVTVGAGANGGTTVLRMANTSQDQTYTASGSGVLPDLEIANGTRTVSAAGGTADLVVRSLILTNGTFVAPSGTLTIREELTHVNGAYDHNSGTMLFRNDATSNITHDIIIGGLTAGLLNVYNLTFGDGGTSTKTYNILGTGDGFFVENNFLAERAGGSSATILVKGGIFDVVGSTTLSTGYSAGSPAPTFTTITSGKGIVSGAVYTDLNGDGTKLTDDPGLSGWTVNLYDNTPTFVASTTTDGAGGYSFLNLTPGTYTVDVVTPADWTETDAPGGTISVSAGENTIVHFGNFQDMTVSGFLFDDRNGDGVWQPNEPGIANRTVQVYTVTSGVVSGSPVATTTTDIVGDYGFVGLGPLAAGTSYVLVGTLADGWVETSLTSSDVVSLPDGRTGYLLPAISGIPITDENGDTQYLTGTGTLEHNHNTNTTSVDVDVTYDDGNGNSGTESFGTWQFNMDYVYGGQTITFNTFCIDMLTFVQSGAVPTVPHGDLASEYVNGSRMVYVLQRYGMEDLGDDPVRIAAVQIALWALSLDNHNPEFFAETSTGVYSSGDEEIFSVVFEVGGEASQVAPLVDRYLKESIGDPTQGGWVEPQNSQKVIAPSKKHEHPQRQKPSDLAPKGCADCPTTMDILGTAAAAGAIAGATGHPVGAQPSKSSTDPVRYNDGVATLVWTDLISEGFGLPWGQSRNWTNGGGYDNGSVNGSGMINTQMPVLLRGDGSTNTTIILVTSGTDAEYFDLDGGTYSTRYSSQNKLTYDSGSDTFTLTDTNGTKIAFEGFGSSQTYKRGSFKSFTDAYGNVTEATARDGSGRITEVQRYSTVGTTVYESWFYEYLSSGANAGNLENVTLRRGTTSTGSWTTVRSVSYTYWETGNAYGNTGNLKSATIKDSSGSTIDTMFYRYYTDGSGTGYKHGLKYAFGPASYARAVAAGFNPETATDGQVDDFADIYLEYDSFHRVTRETVQGDGCTACSGGLGTYTFSYTESANADGFNSWHTKTIETLPDNNQNIVYTNVYGQVMLSIFKEGSNEWKTFYKYDSDGRLVLAANPSAVSGYDDNEADLVEWDGDDYVHLRDDAGVITLFTHYTSTTATESTAGGVAGYLQEINIKKGESGTAVKQGEIKYFVRTAGNVTVVPFAEETIYRNDNGTGGQTTKYVYTWHSGTTQLESVQTILPTVTAAQNGPDTPASTLSLFDTYGRMTWHMDAEGYLSYFEYDDATGALVKAITDVDTSQTSDFGTLPAVFAGLRATYYNHNDFHEGTVIRFDPVIDFTWGTGSPDPSIGSDTFASRWVGKIKPTYSETYTFYATKNDGVRVWIDGTLVIDAWSSGSGTHSGAIALTGGQWYDIIVEHYELTGTATMQLEWQSSSQSRQIVPAAAFSVAGLHLITTMEVDDLGRTTMLTQPGGTVSYTTYNDANHEVRIYAGWNDSTDTPTGPTIVIREDRPGSYLETITMSATPNVSGDRPTGTESIGSLESLSRSYVSAGGQITSTRDYFNLSGLTYSTSVSLGTKDTHYYETLIGYDNRGRQNRVVTPNGTIMRYVYDGLGRVVATLVGTDDTVSGYNLVQVSSAVYDNGGVGDSNLTQSLQYVDTFYNDFNHADTTNLGANWIEQVGDLEILSNQLYGNDSVSLATYANTTEADVSVQMYVDLTGTEVAGLVARYAGSGDQNMYLGQLVGTGSEFTAKISKNISGTWTDLATMTLPVAATGTLRFEVVDDVLRLYFNDRLILSTQDGDITAAGKVGIRTNAGVSVDNFIAKTSSRKSEFFYDWRNRLVVTKSGVDGGTGAGVQRPITYYEYDNLNQVVAMEYYDGDTDTSPGDDGNSDGVPDKPSSSLRRARSETSFDELGRVFQTRVFSVDQGDGTVSSDSLKTSFWYDHRSNVIKVTTPGSGDSKMVYDGAGRLIKTYIGAASGDSNWGYADDVAGDRISWQQEYEYDANSNIVLTTTRERFHELQSGTTGELGTPSTLVFARVSYVAYYYDLGDRLTDVVNVGTNGGSAYTRPGTVPSRSDTVLVTSYNYSSQGLVDIVTDPRGIEARTTYDDLGRVLKTIEGYDDGTPSTNNDRTTEYTYDGNSNLLTVKAWSSSTDYQITQYLYGISVVDSGVSSNDVVFEIRYPDPSTGNPSTTTEREFYLYNGAGEVTSFTDRNGNVHNYTYDVLGRVLTDVATTLGSGVDGTIRRLETSYETAGRVEKLTSYDAYMGGNVVNEVQREYNGLGQLITEYQEHGGAVNTGSSLKVQYVYSEMASSANHSRLTQITYPNGTYFEYIYTGGWDGASNDALSRVSAIRQDGTLGREGYAYLGLGTVVRRARANNGTELTYAKRSMESDGDAGDQYIGLDRFGRVVDQRWMMTGDGTTLDRIQYGYDRNGNRLYADNLLNNDFDELFHANGASNGYDNLNQLVEYRRGALSDANSDTIPDTVTTANRTQAWTMDGQGNFSNVNIDGTGTSRTHNAQNELTNVGANSLTYDNNGNMTTDETGKIFIWDAWNRLVEVQDSGTTTLVTYDNDALGRRIAEDTGTVRDFFYSDRWQLIEERVAGTTRVINLWSPHYVDEMAMRLRDSDNNGSLEQIHWVHQDANYNVTSIMAFGSAPQERYAYDPYGGFTIYAANWSGRGSSSYAWMNFHQGLRFEDVPDLYYNRNRWLSPTLMRFVSVDPIGFGGGQTNLYAYVGNGPVGALDPSGQMPNKYGAKSRQQMVAIVKQLEDAYRKAHPGTAYTALGALKALKDYQLRDTPDSTHYYVYSRHLKTWIDMRHFAECAIAAGYSGKRPLSPNLNTGFVIVGGVIQEMFQGALHATPLGAFFPDAAASAFTAEDHPSNSLGAHFGTYLSENKTDDLSTILDRMFAALDVIDPKDVTANISSMPYESLPDHENDWQKSYLQKCYPLSGAVDRKK